MTNAKYKKDMKVIVNTYLDDESPITESLIDDYGYAGRRTGRNCSRSNCDA